MIIDSHTHYSHARFDGTFPYLCKQDGAYAVRRTDREGLIREMKAGGIVGFIEPSIGFDNIEKQLALTAEHGICAWAALGVHPTRCVNTSYGKRKSLAEYAENNAPVAIGETGLDYHYPRQKQHRLRQKLWFGYHIGLAHRLKLPLVLHIRMAHPDALKILQKHAAKLHGGVVHCFSGDFALAEKYIALGFALGIGGKLLCDDEEGRILCETVKRVPLTSLLVETDAPFVLPDTGEMECSKKQRRKMCNSSHILPDVIQKIAVLRNETYENVENAIYQNTLRVFNLTL